MATLEEVAAKQKLSLDAQAEKLLEKRKKLYNDKLTLEQQQDQLQKDLKDYRIASVNRVLDFIRLGVERLEPNTIHILLTHCMNKLYGNIDGIECILKYDKPNNGQAGNEIKLLLSYVIYENEKDIIEKLMSNNGWLVKEEKEEPMANGYYITFVKEAKANE